MTPKPRKTTVPGPRPTPRPGRGAAAGLAALLAIATFLVYAPVATHPFLHYDDNLYVTENARVQAGITREGVAWAFTTGHAANWHPLTWLSHMLDCQLFGLDPARHHLENAALHAAAAGLTLLVLVSMTGALWPSAFVAATFALHPLHVESVAWAAERKDVLSGLFWMLTLAAYVSYARRGGKTRYSLALAAFAAGLLCKPMLVTMPFVLLLVDFWPLGRLRLGGKRGAAPPQSRVWLEKVPFLALSAASSAITVVAQRRGGAMSSLQAVPLADRVGNAALAYVAYIKKTVWPSDLAIFYPKITSPGWEIAVAVLAILAATAATVALARRKPYLPVGWLWFLGTLVPMIGLVQVGMQSMADRYVYVPLIGLTIIVAWGLPDALGRWRGSRAALAVAACAALIAMTLVTARQIAYWGNERALFQHAIDVTRENYVAHTNVGVALHVEGNLGEAMRHYREAERLRPNYEVVQYNLGLALAQQGRPDSAEIHLREAVRLRPNYPDARNNLGILLAMQNRLPEAETQFREALRGEPFHVSANYNLGLVLAGQGRTDEAIAQYEEALRLKPGYPEAKASLEQARRVKAGTSPGAQSSGADTRR
jgi:tetratricopeptide (TPR) repeat protein